MKKRLFVALDIPESIQERIERLCSGLPGARWVNPHQFHLTLCFIGEVDGATFHDIREELTGVRTSHPFSMRLDGVGFFPPRGKPRVLWIGVEPTDDLHNLEKKIHNKLMGMKLPLEKRKFHPHITLARLNNTPASKVGRYLEHHSLFLSEPFQVESFKLYSSVLSPKGAKHLIEQEYLIGTR